MKKLKFCLLIIIFISASCAKDQLLDPQNQVTDHFSSKHCIAPKIKIAVVSDIHYMDQSIMPDDVKNNPYFLEYLSKDRKLLEVSDPIFRKVVFELFDEKPDILIITGDMAKDGELVNHEAVKKLLQLLEKRKIKVYVIPGNNDINNPDAVSYKYDPPLSVPTITPEEFADLYGDFGYNEAIYRDANSLSYICQPYSGLWILGIDAIKYSQEGVSGAINPATLAWIQEKMAEANENNIRVLAMMHYGILEHYTGQKGLEPLIKSSLANATALMDAGIRLIFTGHYHANDIVDYSSDGKTLTDIQTGSLVTPLSPYRIMTLDDDLIQIETRRISCIKSRLLEGMDFLTYSDLKINERLNSFFIYVLKNMFGLPEEQALIAAPYLVRGYKAYFAGDETITPAERSGIDEYAKTAPSFVVNILNNIWTDLPPQDNKISIQLN